MSTAAVEQAPADPLTERLLAAVEVLKASAREHSRSVWGQDPEQEANATASDMANDLAYRIYRGVFYGMYDEDRELVKEIAAATDALAFHSAGFTFTMHDGSRFAVTVMPIGYPK